MDASGPAPGGAGEGRGQQAASPGVFFEPVTEENIDKTERDVIMKANKAIVGLESALASWDAADDKPDYLRGEFEKYRLLHDALVDWETDMLRSMGQRMDFFERVDRLKEFIRIADRYT